MNACLHSALPTLHAKHTRHITLSSEPRLALAYFFALSYKQHDFREKVTAHKICFEFLCKFCTKHLPISEEVGEILS